MLESNQVNAVVVANAFNLNIFQQIWLIENNIISKDEFESGNCFNTPVAVNVPTQDFDLLIVPDRAQLILRNTNLDVGNSIKRILGGIVEALPHTPYSAIGVNFNNILTSNNQEQFNAKCKELFLSSQSPLAAEFESDDSRFGVYSSKDMFNARLRLDIKPTKSVDGHDSLLMNFNVHKNTSSPESILEFIDIINNIQKYTVSLTNMLDATLEAE